MPEDYPVEQGDCISSIAFERGFFWQTLWNQSNNASLKSKRKDPNVLMEGDTVHIPDRALKQESGATDARHRFRRKGVPEKVKFTIRQGGKPFANAAYSGTIDSLPISGKTDGNGNIELSIRPNARLVNIKVGEGDEMCSWEFKLGGLDPFDSVSGVQARLDNLGYSTSDDDQGILGRNTKAAIKKFQIDKGLEPTGKLDETLCNKLKEAFAC